MKDRRVKEYFRCYMQFSTEQDIYIGVLHDGKEEIINEEKFNEWWLYKQLKDEVRLVEMRKEFDAAMGNAEELLKSIGKGDK